jgi:hypothetical protein
VLTNGSSVPSSFFAFSVFAFFSPVTAVLALLAASFASFSSRLASFLAGKQFDQDRIRIEVMMNTSSPALFPFWMRDSPSGLGVGVSEFEGSDIILE